MLICPICHSLYGPDDEIVFLKCGHLYHSSCVNRWFQTCPSGRKRECPNCRKKVSGKPLPAYGQFEPDIQTSAPIRISSTDSTSNNSGSWTSISLDEISEVALIDKWSAFKKEWLCSKKAKSNELTDKLECEFVEALKKLNGFAKQLKKSENECKSFRNLLSSKDLQINSLCDQVQSLNATVSTSATEHSRVKEENKALQNRIALLNKANFTLATENSELSGLKWLIPIGELVRKRSNEMEKRVCHFKKLAAENGGNADEALQLLINYCVLVDSELQETKSEAENLRAELIGRTSSKHLKGTGKKTATAKKRALGAMSLTPVSKRISRYYNESTDDRDTEATEPLSKQRKTAGCFSATTATAANCSTRITSRSNGFSINGPFLNCSFGFSDSPWTIKTTASGTGEPLDLSFGSSQEDSSAAPSTSNTLHVASTSSASSSSASIVQIKNENEQLQINSTSAPTCSQLASSGATGNTTTTSNTQQTSMTEDWAGVEYVVLDDDIMVQRPPPPLFVDLTCEEPDSDETSSSSDTNSSFSSTSLSF